MYQLIVESHYFSVINFIFKTYLEKMYVIQMVD